MSAHALHNDEIQPDATFYAMISAA